MDKDHSEAVIAAACGLVGYVFTSLAPAYCVDTTGARRKDGLTNYSVRIKIKYLYYLLYYILSIDLYNNSIK